MDINSDTSGCARSRLIKTLSPTHKNRNCGIRRVLTGTVLLHAAAVFLLVTVFFCGTGCRFDSKGVPVGDWIWECTINQCACIHLGKKANVKVVKPKSPSCHIIKEYLMVGDPVYCDDLRPKLYDAGSCIDFKLSTVISLPFKAGHNTSANWLEVQVLEDTAGFFLAYDDRVKQRPPWLNQLFDPSKDPISGQDRFITVTVPSPGPYKQRKMKIYKWKGEAPKGGDVIHLDGNAYQYPSVAANPPLTTLMMYVPFFLPKYDESDQKCPLSKFCKDTEFKDKICECEAEDLETWVKDKCDADLKDKKLYNWTCDKLTATCKPVAYCAESQCAGSQGSAITMLSYAVSSVVEFVPAKSKTTFTLEREAPITKQVTGTIHFEYVYEKVACACMKTMRINDLHVDIPNMTIKGVNFTDITITLNRVGSARCSPIQIGGTPCASYAVDQGQLSFNFSFKEDGKQKLILADNGKGAATVGINQKSRQLELTGMKLDTPVDIGGDRRNLEMKFDLFGNFKNFAPYASGKESEIEVECQELANKNTIHLTAAASFDPQNTLPSPPALTYEWYEDYGLPTQKSLGKGKDCYIKPGAMKFGVHQVTLVVRDSFGAAGTDTFDVTVKDTKPPSIVAPNGFLACSLTGGGVKLDLGKPNVYDDCQSGDVWVTNDAPEWFFPGLHTITWTADDGSGNTSQDKQKISVIGAVMVHGADVGLPLPPGGFGPHPMPGDFTITAAGADIGDTADQFFYAYSVDPESGETHYVQGDFSAVVRVESMEPYETAHEWAKAGIMARAGFEPESPHFMVLRSSKMGAAVQGRDGADAESWHIPMGDYAQSDHVWLRLDRHGSTFTGSYAIGGETLPATWIAVVSHEVDLPAELLLGLATTSHEQGVPITVDYTDFYMGAYAAPPVLVGPELPPDCPAGGDGYMGIREVIDNGEIPDQGACYASLASGAGTIVDYGAPVLNIHDSDGNGNYGSDEVFGVVIAGHRDYGTVDDICLIASGTVHIPPSDCPEGCSEWTFGFNSDDGCTLQFPGHDFIWVVNGEIANFESGAALRFPGTRPAADTLGVINLPPGDHPFWLTYHEGWGGAAVELFAAKGAYPDFNPGVFHLVGDPGGLQLVAPAFDSFDCFPACHPDHPEWVTVGMPECWCYPRQCHGDVDDTLGGSTKTGQYYVGPADLSVLINSWLVKEPPHGLGIASVPNGICADFAHDQGGSEKTGVYRVGPTDLSILIVNWLKKEPPHGPGLQPDCLDCP